MKTAKAVRVSPGCGARNRIGALERRRDFDRCPGLASLHPPPAALGEPAPAGSRRDLSFSEKEKDAFASFFSIKIVLCISETVFELVTIQLDSIKMV